MAAQATAESRRRDVHWIGWAIDDIAYVQAPGHRLRPPGRRVEHRVRGQVSQDIR